ncbi:hypothetical protein SAMN02927930_02110 [Pseudidiomarina indica]|uniref:Uncharacterized protein n=1 Tax=Pseudidiomarina indica TaxID=1159017 RepID=A0A1G6E8B5_9GAMM|nr:hypothetical protein [Pseudidiomarina indica]SDB53687.1 hypothetical protein SAMN02927930_02110 [Pseudidiomarina indica]
MSFPVWTQVITQIITAVTAVVMAVLAYRTYLIAPEQEEAEPENASDNQAEGSLREILVFRTSKQKTWLAVKEQGLSCRIDDTRAGKGGPQWVLSKTEAKAILESGAYHVNPGYKVRTGTFTIGPRRNWLYTKSLFPEPDYLETILKKLLENASS